MDRVIERPAPPTAGLTAAAMAAAVAADPQFAPPVRPRLVEHLVVVELDDGLVVEGTGERQVLRGRAATDLVPALLPLLDGSRDLDELAAATGRPGAHVHAAVALLYTCGLLEDSADHGPDGSVHRPDGIPPEVAAFLGRHLDTTRVNRSAAAALTRLAGARVVVTAPAGEAAALAGTLRRTGVGQVTVAPAGDWQAPLAAAAADGIDLLVVLADAGTDLTGLDEWCAAARVPWLRSAHTTAGIEVGPRFESGHTACHRCFAQEWPATPVPPTDRARASWHGLLVDEVVALVSRVGSAASTAGVQTLDLAGWQWRGALVPRRPDCPRCCPGPPAGPAEPGLAFRYEQSVAFPPRHLLGSKDHQHHYRPANLALQTLAKEYPGARHEELPEPDRTPDPAGTFAAGLGGRDLAPAAAVDKTVLAGLLLRTAGRRDPGPAAGGRPAGKVPRWAPTGGNLGSVEPYLLAVEVDGLSPGWYCYEAARHRLALVRRCAGAPAAGTTGVLGAPPAPPRPAAAELVARIADDRIAPAPAALIVLTGALARVARKYAEFGYRIVHLDAGVATAQLQAVAAGYGLGTRVAHRWDDELLQDELRLDTTAEPVTAVIGLYGRDRG